MSAASNFTISGRKGAKMPRGRKLVKLEEADALPFRGSAPSAQFPKGLLSPQQAERETEKFREEHLRPFFRGEAAPKHHEPVTSHQEETTSPGFKQSFQLDLICAEKLEWAGFEHAPALRESFPEPSAPYPSAAGPERSIGVALKEKAASGDYAEISWMIEKKMVPTGYADPDTKQSWVMWAAENGLPSSMLIHMATYDHLFIKAVDTRGNSLLDYVGMRLVLAREAAAKDGDDGHVLDYTHARAILKSLGARAGEDISREKAVEAVKRTAVYAFGKSPLMRV